MRDSVVLIPNTHRPDWPAAPKPARPKDEQDATRFEKENALYQKEVAKLQKTVPWMHCNGSENLSFREAVLEWVADLNQEVPLSEGGKLERTICWVGEACPKRVEDKSLTVEPVVVFEPWREDFLGRSRYVFLTFKVIESGA